MDFNYYFVCVYIYDQSVYIYKANENKQVNIKGSRKCLP